MGASLSQTVATNGSDAIPGSALGVQSAIDRKDHTTALRIVRPPVHERLSRTVLSTVDNL